MLIQQGANPSHVDEDGVTPLGYAASVDFIPTDSESNVKIAQMLIYLGAHPNHIDAWGNTPLIKATQNGNYEVAKVLTYGGADPNSHDCFGYAPLAWAKEVRNSRFIELFIKEGADIGHAGTPKCASSGAAVEDKPPVILD